MYDLSITNQTHDHDIKEQARWFNVRCNAPLPSKVTQIQTNICEWSKIIRTQYNTIVQFHLFEYKMRVGEVRERVEKNVIIALAHAQSHHSYIVKTSTFFYSEKRVCLELPNIPAN